MLKRDSPQTNYKNYLRIYGIVKEGDYSLTDTGYLSFEEEVLVYKKRCDISLLALALINLHIDQIADDLEKDYAGSSFSKLCYDVFLSWKHNALYRIIFKDYDDEDFLFDMFLEKYDYFKSSLKISSSCPLLIYPPNEFFYCYFKFPGQMKEYIAGIPFDPFADNVDKFISVASSTMFLGIKKALKECDLMSSEL